MSYALQTVNVIRQINTLKSQPHYRMTESTPHPRRYKSDTYAIACELDFKTISRRRFAPGGHRCLMNYSNK